MTATKRRKTKAARKLARWRATTPHQGIARRMYRGTRAYLRIAQRSIVRALAEYPGPVAQRRLAAINAAREQRIHIAQESQR